MTEEISGSGSGFTSQHEDLDVRENGWYVRSKVHELKQILPFKPSVLYSPKLQVVILYHDT